MVSVVLIDEFSKNKKPWFFDRYWSLLSSSDNKTDWWDTTSVEERAEIEQGL